MVALRPVRAAMVFCAPLAALLLISCASAPRGTFCSIAKPHRFSDATVNAMSDAEVKQELAFNKTGAKLCGWRP